MPIIQPCQNAACQNAAQSYFEETRVKSFEHLKSLSTDTLLNLLTNWFKDFPQNESCNFTSSLFANANMDEKTLRKRKSILEFTLRRIEILSTNPEVNPMVIKYSKKLIDLAIADHCAWLDIKYGVLEFAFLNASSMEKTSKKIFSCGNEIVSSLKFLQETRANNPHKNT